MKALIHDRTKLQLGALMRGRSGSFIFHGPKSVGKATVAFELARDLNCLGDALATCGPCRQFEAGSYPDVVIIRPEDKPSITIEQIRTLVRSMSLSLYHSRGVRVVVIDGAHLMTTDAQNALLKLLEEPPAQTLFILVTDRFETLLPTVRSRCGAIFFPPIPADTIANLLETVSGIKPSEAAMFAGAASGAPGQAIMLQGSQVAAEERLELARHAEQTLEMSLFERLLLAKQLSEAKSDLATFAMDIQTIIIEQVKNGNLEILEASGRLDAIEHFRCILRAKVSPRVAIERLMLAL